jgi:hypothetical protein
MTIQKNIIKSENLRAVVHIYASAAGDTTTIQLNDLMGPGQTSSTSTLMSVSIANAYSNSSTISDSSITVRRGGSSGTVVLDLHGFTEYPGAQQLPAVALDSNSSIHVLFEASGMLVLDLRKLDGFISPNRNIGV